MDDTSRCRATRWLLTSLAALIIWPINLAEVSASTMDGAEGPGELEPVTLQLSWYHQFQFAGYYAALEQGYFRDAGLDVDIRHGGYSDGKAPNPVEEVLSNRAEFGVSRSDLLIHHGKEQPVAVLANIMQRSPMTFLTLERYGLTRLEEIGDRPITLSLPRGGDERLNGEALAALHAAGIDPHMLNNSPSTWRLEDLLDGTTKLISAYSTDETYFVGRYGEVPVEISPSEYGVNFYGDLLFTHRDLLEQQPDLVDAFRQASLKGWSYALENIDEVAELIERRYETRHAGYNSEFLRHEALRMIELMQPELIEIGYINPTRWEAIAERYQSLGMIDQYDLESFLHTPTTPAASDSLPYFWRWAILALAVLSVAVTLACYLHMMNRELRREMDRRKSAEHALRHQAEKDGLTGIDNRRLFEKRLQQEFDRSRRHGRALSVIMFDVDHFKRFNDTHGHLVGDQVLVQIATVTHAVLRSCDHFARYGGEEFVVLLPDTELEEASLIAKRIWQANREHRVITDSLVIGYTLSLGVATLSPDDENGHQLLQRADTQLYRAKETGRDRCCQAV